MEKKKEKKKGSHCPRHWNTQAPALLEEVSLGRAGAEPFHPCFTLLLSVRGLAACCHASPAGPPCWNTATKINTSGEDLFIIFLKK